MGRPASPGSRAGGPRRRRDSPQDRRPGERVPARAAADGRRGAPLTANARVQVAVQGGALTAPLNRPDKKAAIDTPMSDARLAALARADLDAAVRVVAL